VALQRQKHDTATQPVNILMRLVANFLCGGVILDPVSQYPTVPVNESYNLLAVFTYCISPRTGTDRNLALVYDPSTWVK
jgi:hypothetical protein